MNLFDANNLEIFLRLVVAMALGIAIGAERIAAKKTAGMRTYGLVSMAAALFVVISETMSAQYAGITNVDPLRMASQLVVGIGFIGAGLIIFREQKIRGLTTAVGLWVATGIGMAAGFGLYIIAIFATILTLFIFTVMWFIETKLKKVYRSLGISVKKK